MHLCAGEIGRKEGRVDAGSETYRVKLTERRRRCETSEGAACCRRFSLSQFPKLLTKLFRKQSVKVIKECVSSFLLTDWESCHGF